jgi:uncharacterized radical SAM superfamily Fe-S cluster-containing enzyme
MEDRKDGTDKDQDGNLREKKSFVCPVCGKLLHEVNLPDMRSIIEDTLYHVDGVRIVNSQIQLYCDFEHRFEKEEQTLDEPHGLTGLVNVVFDELGTCIQFNLVKVYPHR